MAATTWPSGIGEANGDSLLTGGELTVSGDVWFVNSATGNDSYNGRDRVKPLATIQQAVTNSAAGDIIVLIDGHQETITSSVTITKALIIAASGRTTAGKPTVHIKSNLGAASLIFNASGCQLRNIWLEAGQQTNSAGTVIANSNSLIVDGCYFECGQYDLGGAVLIASNAVGDSAAADRCRIVRTTFISTATSVAAQPWTGVKVTGATTLDLYIGDCTFDGGTAGFGNFYAVTLGPTVTRFFCEGVTLLNGADMKLSTGTTGYVNAVGSGGSRVNWKAGVVRWANGMGGSGGDRFTTEKPIVVSPSEFFVSSRIGSDANSGYDPLFPFATLDHAMGVATAGTIIVLMDGHTETINTSYTVTTGIVIVGATRSNGKPTAKLTLNFPDDSMFVVMNGGFVIGNVWFTASLQSGTGGRIKFQTTDGQCLVRGCYFESFGTVDVSAISIGIAQGIRIEDCTFVSTATSVGSRPTRAIDAGGLAQTISDVEITGCTFDARTNGFSDYAIRTTSATTVTRFRVEACSFLRGCDVGFLSTQTGHIQVSTSTGGANVAW